jgi:hypothetical protein
VRRWCAGLILALGCLAATPAAAIEPDDFSRKCKRHDLIGMWRVMRLGVVGGGELDKTNPAFLPHQRYVFHSNATMAVATQEVPFTADEQRALMKAPSSATWAMEGEGRLVRQRDGMPVVDKADCRVLTRAVKDPKTSQPTAQVGDILLTDEKTGPLPPMRRLLRRIRVQVD